MKKKKLETKCILIFLIQLVFENIKQFSMTRTKHALKLCYWFHFNLFENLETKDIKQKSGLLISKVFDKENKIFHK